MSSVTIIKPSEITEGTAQEIAADLTKFDKASAQVELAVKSLVPFETISSTDEQTKALEALKLANSVSKAIEEKRTTLVKPFNDAVKKINTYAKDLTSKIDTKVNAIKSVVLQYQKDEEIKAFQKRVENRTEVLEKMGFVKSYPQQNFFLENVGTVTFSDVRVYEDAEFQKIIDGFNAKIKSNAENELIEIQQDDDLLGVFGSDYDAAELVEKAEQARTIISAPTLSYTTVASPSKLKGSTKTWTYEITDNAAVPREYLTIDEATIKAAIKEGARSIAGVRIFQKDSLTLR